MQTIYKYPLQIKDEQSVTMKDGSKILSVGVDPRGDVCVWAQVDTNKCYECEKKFFIVGTGHPMPDVELSTITFLGTVNRGSFMWHVFVEN